MDRGYAKLLDEVVTDTTVVQNADVFNAAFQPTRDAGFCRVMIAVQSAVKVRLVSPDSGSGFDLNGGVALVANGLHVEDVPLDVGRSWNVQTTDVAGMTVSILRVQELARIA